MARVCAAVLAPTGSLDTASLDSARAQQGTELEVLVVAPTGPTLPTLPEGVRVLRVPASASPAALRNAAVREARAPYVCLVEPGERLEGTDALAAAAAALDADPAALAVYGRTLVEEKGARRARPERGRSGRILRPLVQYKAFVSALASVVWRREELAKRGFGEAYRTPQGLLLALLVDASHDDEAFAFLPRTQAVTGLVRDDPASLEEKVKIFVALLYGASRLDERIEVRVRFRLARHLVALGKLHYRKGDHTRAGKLFGEAVKAAPSYFKGRRYQFMNFLKGVIAR